MAAIHLDLNDLGLRGGERHERTYAVDLEPIMLGGVAYNVILPDGATITVDRIAGGFVVGLSAGARIYGPCERCLTDVALAIHAEQQEFAPTARDGWEESELSAFIDGLVVDVSGVVREAVILALPDKIVCATTCKGLCPQCGRNLNDGECACAPRQGDERWAELAELRLDEGSGS